ncbi:MAG: DUF2141 domain-containing protein [Symploca sp. SIO2G7]|nr:DUF2141 domain-containing protein [Symploca sp. SIO2G7]
MDSRYGLASAMAMVVSWAAPTYGHLSQPAQLAVEIVGLKGPQGQVCLNLFDSTNGFPSNRDEAVATLCIAIADDGPLVATFEELPPGSYAVSVFHDANGDGEFNRNFVGMPVEGFGFSSNPNAVTGPPDYSEAVFLVVGDETRIEIELNYF